MIDKKILIETIEGALAGTDCYLVECKVSPDNTIEVEIDSDSSVDIDTCAAVNRAIEGAFDRDADDYSVEVGSAGITTPLKLRRQYLKNIGSPVEVLTKAGRKVRGTLVAVAEGEPLRFTLRTEEKVRPEGAKRPVVQNVDTEYAADDCKYVRPEIIF